MSTDNCASDKELEKGHLLPIHRHPGSLSRGSAAYLIQAVDRIWKLRGKGTDDELKRHWDHIPMKLEPSAEHSPEMENCAFLSIAFQGCYDIKSNFGPPIRHQSEPISYGSISFLYKILEVIHRSPKMIREGQKATAYLGSKTTKSMTSEAPQKALRD